MPFDAETIQFWICDRIQSIGTIKSFHNWTSMLQWIAEVAQKPSPWKTHPSYTHFVRAIHKQYGETSDERLYLKYHHILQYTQKMGVTPSKYKSVSLNKLLKVLLIQLYFLSGSRPNELLKYDTKKSTNGLKLKDLKYYKLSDPHKNYHSFTITTLKNQRTQNTFKTFEIAQTHCTKWKKCPLKCIYINPSKLLYIYLWRRQKIAKQIATAIKENSLYPNEATHLKKASQNLPLKPNNYAFIWRNGKITTTVDLAHTIDELVKILKLEEPHRYTAYSLRIGCTTRAQAVGIDHPKILKYIGWADSRLPHVSFRYMRYNKEELREMAFEIIHGPIQKSDFTKLKIDLNNNIVYDPWSYKTRFSKHKR